MTKRAASEPTRSEESPLLTGMMAASRKELGEESGILFAGEDMEAMVVGLPLPSVALMWLLDSNVLPLGKIIGLAGFPQSQKSALGFEIARWFTDCGGYTKLVECEGAKVSPTLLRSIVGSGTNRVMIAACPHIDAARKHTVMALNYLKEHDKKKTVPFLVLLDSLTGASTEENSGKLMDASEDFGGRGFPVAALFYSEFLKTLSSELVGWPHSFVFVAHLKTRPNAMPGLPPSKTMPGGAAPMFHSSYVFWIDRIGSEQRMTHRVGGKVISRPTDVRRISITCHKNSLGTDARSITVDFAWHHVNGVQTSYFDWDTSTTRLLASMQDAETSEARQFKGGKLYGKGLKDIVDIEVETASLCRSKVLGMEGASLAEIGHAIHSKPEIVAALLDFLHIKKHPIFAHIKVPENVPQVAAEKAGLKEDEV